MRSEGGAALNLYLLDFDPVATIENRIAPTNLVDVDQHFVTPP